MRQTNILKLSYSWPLSARQCQGHQGELRLGRPSALTPQVARVYVCACLRQEGKITSSTGRGEYTRPPNTIFPVTCTTRASEVTYRSVASMYTDLCLRGISKLLFMRTYAPACMCVCNVVCM